jgi:adenylosuccinate lyase
MIPRYTRPEMGKIWEEENKYRTWLQIEILASEAQSDLGLVPAAALAEIKAKADFDVQRIEAIEAEVQHDVIAFLTSVKEYVGEPARFIHLGMTSSDVLDTSLSVLMCQAMDILLADCQRVQAALIKLAKEHKNTPMVGRTHGVHAEPITFGLKMALWLEEMRRNTARLERARESIAVGKISGAVGTFANISPKVEEYVCAKLGLKPASVSTQIIQRDRHAEFMNALAVTASSLEKFATEIRGMQRTEVREAEEPFGEKQKGSSAMPHKRNPVVCERICGLARLVRANALAAMENIPLWQERDISHSSVERIIIPDACMALDYMLVKFAWVMEGLKVNADRMQANIDLTGGLTCSQQVLLALIEKGMSREDAYRTVQVTAMQAWNEGGNFREMIGEDPAVRQHLQASELEKLFDPALHLKNVDTIFQRIGL